MARGLCVQGMGNQKMEESSNKIKTKAELSGMSSSARQAKLRALQAAVRSKQDACDELASQLWRCNFVYSPPEPHFDSRKVMGTLCSLIDWCDPIHCTAVEVAAGELMYSVVVDSEMTSNLLQQCGNLQRDTNFIPLNEINGHVIDRKTVKEAQRIGGGPENVQLALDLVSFDCKYQTAMNWAFGSTLVCKDFGTAKKVAFHPALLCRVVTLDGDILNPDGTLTGGAMPTGLVLAKKQAHKKLEADLKTTEAELSLFTAELQEVGEK